MTWLFAFIRYGLPNVPSNIADAWRTHRLRRRIAKIRAAQPSIDAQGIIDQLEAEDARS